MYSIMRGEMNLLQNLIDNLNIKLAEKTQRCEILTKERDLMKEVLLFCCYYLVVVLFASDCV